MGTIPGRPLQERDKPKLLEIKMLEIIRQEQEEKLNMNYASMMMDKN